MECKRFVEEQDGGAVSNQCVLPKDSKNSSGDT
jgi:hypothetical protein